MKPMAITCLVVTSIIAVGSCQNQEPDYPPPGGGEEIGTDQGWNYDTAQAWYHVDQGTAFFPYEWFVALEQAEGQERFAASGNMQRFGFLPNPSSVGRGTGSGSPAPGATRAGSTTMVGRC